MGLVQVSEQEIIKKTEEERENEHLGWLRRKIYAKTPLTTFMYCREKWRQKYDLLADEYWGPDLVAGMGGHKVTEVYHLKAMRGVKFYPDEMRQVFMQEVAKLEHRLDSSQLMDRDSYAAEILPVCQLYMERWRDWYAQVLTVERTWGADGNTQFGGVSIAGHTDIEANDYPADEETVPDKLVVDLKFCGKSSWYRQPVKFDVGMELYKAGLKPQRTALLPMVRGYFKRLPAKPKQGQVSKAHGDGYILIDGLNPIPHSRSTKQTAELLVAHMAEEIEKGNLAGGPSDIGKNLCQPAYCSFFGRCKFTKHLNRKAFK